MWSQKATELFEHDFSSKSWKWSKMLPSDGIQLWLCSKESRRFIHSCFQRAFWPYSKWSHIEQGERKCWPGSCDKTCLNTTVLLRHAWTVNLTFADDAIYYIDGSTPSCSMQHWSALDIVTWVWASDYYLTWGRWMILIMPEIVKVE